jgi:hypothetical protein
MWRSQRLDRVSSLPQASWARRSPHLSLWTWNHSPVSLLSVIRRN